MARRLSGCPGAAQVDERASVASDGTQANRLSVSAAVSADGRIVAFASSATNLVAGCGGVIVRDRGTVEKTDIFVRDRLTGTTTCVSVATGGPIGNGVSFQPALSADGRFVAFGSHSTNLVPLDTNGLGDIFVYDRLAGTTTRVSVATDGTQSNGHHDLRSSALTVDMWPSFRMPPCSSRRTRRSVGCIAISTIV